MQTYTDFNELPIIYRGDDEATMKPYGGVATTSDGGYILASRKGGRLAFVSSEGLVLSSCDPLNGHIAYDKLNCYGIVLSADERSLYMLLGEEGSTDLYVSTLEVVPSLPVYRDGANVGNSDPVFRWIPTSDVRLPSVAARGSNYKDFPKKDAIFAYPRLYGFLRVYDSNGNEILIPAGPYEWDKIGKHPIGVPGNFVYEKAWWEWSPIDIVTWGNIYGFSGDIDLFTSLGPILTNCPAYKPCMVGMGSRVMISCQHAQLIYGNSFLTVKIGEENDLFGSVPQGELRQAFFDWLIEITRKFGIVQPQEEDDSLDDPDHIYEIIGPDTPRHWLDLFKEGDWWTVNEAARTISIKLSLQFGFPISSIVTVHPELGTIDGIYNVSTFYPVPHIMSDDRDITLFLNYVDDGKGRGFYVQFWDSNEFAEKYTANPNPTPIDSNFYMRYIEDCTRRYAEYAMGLSNPLEQAKVYGKNASSSYVLKGADWEGSSWDNPIFSQYVTLDEGTVAVHAPTFN